MTHICIFFYLLSVSFVHCFPKTVLSIVLSKYWLIFWMNECNRCILYAISVYINTKCDRFNKFPLFTLLFLYCVLLVKLLVCFLLKYCKSSYFMLRKILIHCCFINLLQGKCFFQINLFLIIEICFLGFYLSVWNILIWGANY